MHDIVGKFGSSLCTVLAKTVNETKIKANNIILVQLANFSGVGGWGDLNLKGCKLQILFSLRVIRT